MTGKTADGGRRWLVPVLVLFIASVSVMLTRAATALEAAGTVLFASGDVAAVAADGSRRALARGDLFYPGETLETGVGRLQARFSDGAMVSIQFRSRFRVDDYNYSGEPDGTERGVFSLLKGGIRTITGAIGRVNRDAYRVNAVVATIGIRGSAYNAELCQLDCFEKADGLYVNTTQGVIGLTNNAGTVEVPAGTTAYVADIDTLPVLTVVVEEGVEETVSPDVERIPEPIQPRIHAPESPPPPMPVEDHHHPEY